jgi:hypothetical protein
LHDQVRRLAVAAQQPCVREANIASAVVDQVRQTTEFEQGDVARHTKVRSDEFDDLVLDRAGRVV